MHNPSDPASARQDTPRHHVFDLVEAAAHQRLIVMDARDSLKQAEKAFRKTRAAVWEALRQFLESLSTDEDRITNFKLFREAYEEVAPADADWNAMYRECHRQTFHGLEEGENYE